MNIVIATAEPRGAYHLAPLHAAMGASPHAFTHLIPYPEVVQGAPWRDTSSNPAVLEKADRLIVTGGGYSAWTELVAWRAADLGIPVLFTELAYGQPPQGRALPVPTALSAMSPASARVHADYHRVPQESVAITGNPLLDALPRYRPEPRHAVILSTVDRDRFDPKGVLLAIAQRLRSDGWKIAVRPHPREDRTMWEGFPLSTAGTPADSAANASVVLGYPGSAHLVAAAIGAPVIAVIPTAHADALPAEHMRIMSGVVRTTEGVDGVLSDARACDPALLGNVIGPIGGSAERIVDFWIRPLP